MQTDTSNSSSQNYFRQPSRRKRNHPDRLKVNIWNIDDEHIKNVRKSYSIDKNIIMRHRGIGKLKRIELWCHNRKSAEELYTHIKSITVSYTHLDVYKRQLLVKPHSVHEPCPVLSELTGGRDAPQQPRIRTHVQIL